jgi:glycosyltransferase involved in cell wall biosynthesis
MSEAPPLLSVVIPTRNRRDMALQAARSALLPLPFPFEVLVSDNASEDASAELAELLPAARYIRRPKLLPMAEHWNLCVGEARGKYIKLLCDDDWLIPGALEREVAALEQVPELAAVASARFEVASGGRKELLEFRSRPCRLSGPALFRTMLLRENILGPPSSVTFRKSAFQGFPTAYAYAADWAAWVLMAEKGGFAFLPEPGVNFRLHETNLTSRHVEEGTDFLEVQALRLECLHRIHGPMRPFFGLCFGWIWLYRFCRRLLRYSRKRDASGLRTFLGRVGTFRPTRLR